MRETELYPLCFIYPGHELKITELLTGQSLAVPGTAGNFYALNLEAVRLKFFTDYGVLANLFVSWSKALDSKSNVGRKSHRGFESHSLRQFLLIEPVFTDGLFSCWKVRREKDVSGQTGFFIP